MKNLTKFQLVLLGLFFIAILAGVTSFALYKGGKSGPGAVKLTIWGPADENFSAFIESFTKETKTENLYVAKGEAAFERDLISAIADGVAPDIIIFPQDSFAAIGNRLAVIPYDSYPARSFKDTFLEEGEMFLTEQGVAALPLSVDPLVLFWNRDSFSAAGLPKPPEFWEEMFYVVSRLAKRTDKGEVISPALAFGEYGNVNHAKEILSALFLQAGTPIVEKAPQGFNAVLSDSVGQFYPAVSVLSFYTDFANPLKAVYSWNKSFPPAKDYFLAGILPIYIGFASEFKEIREKNPNLNFDVSRFPQLKDSKNKITFGKMRAAGVLKTSRNISAAVSRIYSLTGKDSAFDWSKQTGLPSARRDLLFTDQTNPARAVFDQSALWARGWRDPSPSATSALFQRMVEAVVTGRLSVDGAVSRANAELGALLGQ